MEKITIYIITRNRPDSILRSVNSVLSQTYSNIEVLVSDNSTDTLTLKLFEDNPILDQRFLYLNQHGRFSSFVEHTNHLHDIVATNYYVIFHDDDKMLPNMIDEMYNIVKLNKNIIAVGSNAYIQCNNKIKKVFFRRNEIELINDPQKIIKRYISGQIAPFPSYMYNKELILKLRLNSEWGGMYCDVSFLLSLLKNGEIAVSPKILMVYDIHLEQMSNKHNFMQYSSLISYIKKNYSIHKENIVELRVRNIYNELVRREKRFKRKALILFLCHSFTNYFIKYIVRLLFFPKYKEISGK